MICSDDEPTGNPMVAGFQDDLDPEDKVPTSVVVLPSHSIELSSDDEKEVSPKNKKTDTNQVRFQH